MQELRITVDFNGIAIFDPDVLERFYGAIARGENLYRRMTTTDDGDQVVEQGVIVPILGLNDSIYRVLAREEHEPPCIPAGLVVVTNAGFPLQVARRAVIADMACLLEWWPEDGWQQLDIGPGLYSVAVTGFRSVQDGVVADFGFELSFSRRAALPTFTGSLAQDMQVLALPD